MDIYILNQDLETIDIIDSSSSVIWTPSYYDVGDFEIYIQASRRNINLLQEERYVMRQDSDMVGIIEKVKVITAVEDGDYILASGRCLKSLLARRIIWNQTNLAGKTEVIMRSLINDNVINPVNSARKIPNVILGELKGFTEKTDFQSTGEELLEKIIELCKASEIGWKVFINKSKQIEIDFYKGTNRSYSQTENPYIVFSPDFDNLLTTETEIDTQSLRNVALVAGEGEGTDRTTTTIGTEAGLSRRELFVDARDLSSNNGEIEADKYLQILQERGKEKLAAAGEFFKVSGEAETKITYEFGKDYFLGDLVTVVNEYGITANTRILEVIECEDENGHTIIPTFEEWRTI